MKKSISTWVKKISENELPIFNYTIKAINDVVSNEDTSISDLAQIILRDASLTARVLRIANSTRYNVTGSPISTISRAIVFIGFNVVRDISMSLAVIDALLTDDTKNQQLQLMAESFHAAVQARDFAERRGDTAAEEIFIAALLRHIGELSFWCIAQEEGSQITELMEKSGFSPEMAQKEVLGFTFNQLTIELTQDWHLSDLLHSVINKPKMDNPRIRDIVLSQKLSVAAAKNWESDDTNSISQQIAKHINVAGTDIKEILHENSRSAVEVAQLFGAGSITRFIPTPDTAKPDVEIVEPEFKYDCPEPDPFLQLNILRELSGMLESKPNINVILEIVLEGIYRGIGMDRTLFAILTPDKKRLFGKYALGKDNQEFIEKFSFDLDNTIFDHVFKERKPLWLKDTQSADVKHLINENIRRQLAVNAFYLAPIIVSGKVLGAIYADRQPSGRELDITGFDSFKHFTLQTSQAIEYVLSKK